MPLIPDSIYRLLQWKWFHQIVDADSQNLSSFNISTVLLSSANILYYMCLTIMTNEAHNRCYRPHVVARSI